MREQEVASYKIPKALEIIDEMPLGPSGKVIKRNLRDDYEEKHKS